MYLLELARLLFVSIVPFIVQGRTISCVCSTTHCQEQGTKVCNTTSMCFSQYLDRRDGSDPLVRGCITSKTPLLCENRRPAVAHHKWPVLYCCATHMCNMHAVPTLPATTRTRRTTAPTTPLSVPEDASVGVKSHKESSTSVFNSVYLVILVIGICCLTVIAGIAVLLLRRHNAIQDNEFGQVERNGYLKGCTLESAPHICPKENKTVFTT